MDYDWLVTVGLVTSSVITVTANLFLLVIFSLKRGLRTVPNRFVINLLIVNLLSSFLLTPLLLIDRQLFPISATSHHNSTTSNNETTIETLMFEEEIIRTNRTEIVRRNFVDEKLSFMNDNIRNYHCDILCVIAESSATLICTLSILSILLIGINQYFGVIHSLRYHFYINKCRSMVLIAATWLSAILCSALTIVTNSDAPLWNTCHFINDKNLIIGNTVFDYLNTIYAFAYFFVVILTPFVAICVIYVCIYKAAHKNSERMRKSTSANLESNQEVCIIENKMALPKVHSAPNFVNYCDPKKRIANVTRTNSDRTANFILSLKHRISNASVFKYREETRAAKISVLVIVLVLVCHVPYGVTVILNSNLLRIKIAILNRLPIGLLIVSNVISPFLFAYRNKRVKREIKKMLGVPKDAQLQRCADKRRGEDAQCDFGVEEQPFLVDNITVPRLIVTCQNETEKNQRKSILKRVCTSSTWTSYKKCNFITVPDSCISGEARGSFSSASTQISNEE